MYGDVLVRLMNLIIALVVTSHFVGIGPNSATLHFAVLSAPTDKEKLDTLLALAL